MSDEENKEQGGDAGEEHRLSGPWWYSERRSVTEEQRGDVLRQLFYEGPDLVPFLTRFAALMSMAVLIALFGLAQDSSPVVIGAMLVSPLTTPILGLATSLVLGHPRRQLNAALTLLGATVGGIALAIVVTYLLPDPQQTTLSSEQLLARTTPDVLDLAVAVVAGAAGAYILVRREAVSALPGVAIAVALVPPLTTVGMTLELGATDLAGNALLLYCTNLAGIILSASVVMLLMGVGVRPTEGKLPRRIKVGLTTALLAAFVVAVPLVEHTRETLHDATDAGDAEELATGWLAATDLELGDVTVTDNHRIEIEVTGPEAPPDTERLTQELAEEFEEPVVVTVRWTPLQTQVSRAAPDG
jgi:uncharacterized hydrophobic protein (TIGR00271 family)